MELPLKSFLLTWRGKLVEQHQEMNADRIVSLGISLAGGTEMQPPGPYRLLLQNIKARRDDGFLDRPED